MPDKITAEQQLARILDLIPRAQRNSGAPVSELARVMGVSEREIVRDLEEVYTRAYYQPAGESEDVQVLIEGDTVEVWTKGEFRRPIRLNPHESLALALGLRVLAAGAEPSKATELTALANRLDMRLLDPRGTEGAQHFEVAAAAVTPEGPRRVLMDAARDRRQCRISYLKPGAERPEEREIDPYVLLVAEGHWYTIAYCHRSDGIRTFRFDRVLDASELTETFDIPADFTPDAYISGGRVYRPEEFVEVTVRYSSRIARRIAEQELVEWLDSGDVLVKYSVSDPQWIVRHVLEHGADAEVLGPESVRLRMQEVLAGILAEVAN